MRTNHAGVTEVASLRTDKEKYDEGWDRIFGRKNIKVTATDNTSSETSAIESLKAQSEERRVEFENAVDELATLRAEVKEDIEFLLTFVQYCTKQTEERISEIKKKYL